MRRRAVTHKKRQLGQVMIETALAAIGIVVLAFLVAKVGMWLNRSLVQRNQSFQDTRVAAASTSPGLTFAPPEPIHILGPTADATGSLPPQPLGPSSIPPRCSGAGAALLTDAQHRRDDIATEQAGARALQTQAEDLANQARDLIIASPPAGWLCSGDQCKSANWFWDMAQQLRTWQDQLATDQAQLATDQAQLATDQAQLATDQAQLATDQSALTDAQNVPCGGCTTTSVCGAPGRDCSARQACVDAVTAQCNRDYPPGGARNFCMLQAFSCKQPCVDTPPACHDVTDCTARDACESTKAANVSAAQAVVDADQNAITTDQNAITTDQNAITTDQNAITTDQNAITTDQNAITTDQNHIDQICAQTGTGNPWVGGAPACDATAIENYATDVNTQGHTVQSGVDSLVNQLSTRANRIQQYLLEAQDKESQGRAQCASGRDP